MDVEPSVKLVIDYVRGLAVVLQAIRAGNKQACSIKVDSSGLEVRWEDESKALQSLVFLKPEMFGHFSCPSVRKFSVQFSQLLDTLNVFSSTQASMEMAYPGPNGELTFEVKDDSRGPVMCTYARIASVEMPSVRDLEDFWEDPSSYFLTQGAVMKEVMEDLEWPGGNVELLLQREPHKLVVSASGTGRMEVDIPVTELSGFHCAVEEVRHSYKYKSLRAAFCNLPNPKEFGNISTKVTVDANGMLKVTHVISLKNAPQQHFGSQGGGLDTQVVLTLKALAGHASHTLPASCAAVQRLFDLSRSATVNFFVLPLADI